MCQDLRPVSAVELETYDWVDTTNLSRIVADFARVHMLISLFDGDPKKWIAFLDSNGTTYERHSELPVAREFQRRVERDPEYIDRLRELVREFTELVGAT